MQGRQLTLQFGVVALLISIISLGTYSMANITKTEQAEPRGIQAYGSAPSPLSLLDRFFDDGFFEPFSMLAPSASPGRSLGSTRGVFPKVDVAETENEIRVTANVPGVDPDRIDIEVGEDYLSLKGAIEKEDEHKDASGKIYRYERESGEFRREFSLPARVNKGGIRATARNGVLTITLPKSEEERRTKVRVETV